jgi:hypothetical protein
MESNSTLQRKRKRSNEVSLSLEKQDNHKYARLDSSDSSSEENIDLYGKSLIVRARVVMGKNVKVFSDDVVLHLLQCWLDSEDASLFMKVFVRKRLVARFKKIEVPSKISGFFDDMCASSSKRYRIESDAVCVAEPEEVYEMVMNYIKAWHSHGLLQSVKRKKVRRTIKLGFLFDSRLRPCGVKKPNAKTK